MAPALIAAAARDLGVPADRIDTADRPSAAIGAAMLATPTDGRVVITGSLYLIGAARTLLVRP